MNAFMKSGLAAMVVGLSLCATAGTAGAVPAFVNPNFVVSPTPAFPGYSAVPSWGSAGNAGYTPFMGGTPGADAGGFWNNGLAPGGPDGVGFLQSTGSYLNQTVSGFELGHVYNVSIYADARATLGSVMLNIVQNNAALLLGATGQTINAVNAQGAQTANFNSVVSGTFTANSTDQLITFVLQSTSQDGGSVVLTGARINDVTVPDVAVPEPISLAVLSVGLIGTFAARRRSAA